MEIQRVAPTFAPACKKQVQKFIGRGYFVSMTTPGSVKKYQEWQVS